MNKKIAAEIAFGIIVIIALVIGGAFLIGGKKTTEIVSSSLPAKDQPESGNKDSGKQAGGQAEKFLYNKNNDLILYDPLTGKKQVVLMSDKLIDYNLSEDNKLIAFALREDGYEGNSDIYLKNLETGTTTRLTENNDLASLNPKIFPDNSKVAYVRRKFNAATKKLSDGEIWVINADGNINSSKRLLGDDSKPILSESELDKEMDDNGKWTGEYQCISKEEINGAKRGIYEIAPDGKKIAYWVWMWGGCHGGLGNMPYFANIDGTDIFSDKFKRQNTFETKIYDKSEKYDWDVGNIFWFDDGGFMVENGTMPPLGDYSVYYYDKNQNKIWYLYDSSKQPSNGLFSQFILDDLKKISENEIVVAYWLDSNFYDDEYYANGKFVGSKHFVKKFSLGEGVTPEILASGRPLVKEIVFATEEKIQAIKKQYDAGLLTKEENERQLIGLMTEPIGAVEIRGENFVTYTMENTDKSTALYIYDIAKNKETKIDDIN